MLDRLKQQLLLILGLGCFLSTHAQYHPAAGVAGTNAIHKDSSIIKRWSTFCSVERGFVNISDTSYVESNGNSNRASFGADMDGAGKAEGSSMNVVSLGDGGNAVLTFEYPICNKTGPDFVVYENSLTDVFLELAFVEVSSDSINWVRFPAVSNTQDTIQIGAFGNLDPTKINNLAGKYRQGYGTPFDLEDLKDSSKVDIQNVRFVKIIDVVGSINPLYASSDINHNAINDPWPTPFWSCGFDLDAVGVINIKDENAVEDRGVRSFDVFPNPANDFVYLENTLRDSHLKVFDVYGKIVLEKELGSSSRVDIQNLNSGVYFLIVEKSGSQFRGKIIKK